MATKNFEKSNQLADLDENWYQEVIWVAEYEFEVKICIVIHKITLLSTVA